ncbi:MAG: 1-phosphofructokinase family hexose kinase [Spirochaetota bacterium]
MHVLVVCLNPTIQRTYVVNGLRLGEVNRVVEHRTDASGKGVNAARVLASLGAHPTHLSHSGGRDHDLFVEAAGEDGIRMDAVSAEVELRVANTIVDAHNGTTTEVVEEGREVDAGVESRVQERYGELLEDAEAVLIAGSKAPGFSGELFPGMVARARRAGRFVLLDYRGEDLLKSLPYGPNAIKPNFSEFVRTVLPQKGAAEVSEHADDPSLVSAVREEMLRINSEYGCDVVVTRGALPTLYVEDQQVRERQVPAVEVVNTIGSGDAFGAGFLYARFGGASVGEAVRFAGECASKNAARLKPGSID